MRIRVSLTWLTIGLLFVSLKLAHYRIGKLEKHQVELFDILNRQTDSLLTNAQHYRTL